MTYSTLLLFGASEGVGLFGLNDREKQVSKFTEEILRGPLILDPTILISERHLGALQPRPRRLFVSGTWARAVERQDWRTIDRIIGDLSWRFGYREPRETHGIRDFIVETASIGRPYSARAEDLRRLASYYGESWNFARVTDQVLADEYSFLREHSAMVARIRRTYYLFRDKGVAVMDAGDRLLNIKGRFFARRPRLKFLLGVLIPLEAFVEGLSPAARYVGILAQELLAFYDPAPAPC